MFITFSLSMSSLFCRRSKLFQAKYIIGVMPAVVNNAINTHYF